MHIGGRGYGLMNRQDTWSQGVWRLGTQAEDPGEQARRHLGVPTPRPPACLLVLITAFPTR